MELKELKVKNWLNQYIYEDNILGLYIRIFFNDGSTDEGKIIWYGDTDETELKYIIEIEQERFGMNYSYSFEEEDTKIITILGNTSKLKNGGQ